MFIPIAFTTPLYTNSLHAQPNSQDSKTHSLEQALVVSESNCFTAPSLASRIELWLGRTQIDHRIRIHVNDEQDAGKGVVFHLLREGKPRTDRRLRPKNIPCADLNAALGLAIAMAIDATILHSLMEVEPIEPQVPPKPPPPPTRPTYQAKPPSTTPTFQAIGSAHLVGLVGVLPEPTLGGSFQMDLRHVPWLDWRIGGLGTIDSKIRLGKGHVVLGTAAARLGPCLVQPIDNLSIAACSGIVVGRWVARGDGFDVNHTVSLPWAAWVASAEGRFALGKRTSLQFAIDGFFPFLRPSLEIEDPSGGVVASKQGSTVGLGLRVGPAFVFF